METTLKTRLNKLPLQAQQCLVEDVNDYIEKLLDVYEKCTNDESVAKCQTCNRRFSSACPLLKK